MSQKKGKTQNPEVKSPNKAERNDRKPTHGVGTHHSRTDDKNREGGESNEPVGNDQGVCSLCLERCLINTTVATNPAASDAFIGNSVQSRFRKMYKSV